MTKLEKHLFLSDFQIPDQNRNAVSAVINFIKDFKPDHLHLLGDIINLTYASTYEVVGEAPDLGEEINEARAVIYKLVDVTRKANKNVKVSWYEGNHENRLQRYLARTADRLVSITDEEGEPLVTIPHIFRLYQNNIEWIPYYDTRRVGDIEIEHGFISRVKSGYTAHAQIDKRGRSGFSGHTHKLSLVTRNQGGDVKFWIETGSLCNPEPTPRWMKKPDWVNGFAIGYYDYQREIMYSYPILMQENTFYWEGKVYSSQAE